MGQVYFIAAGSEGMEEGPGEAEINPCLIVWALGPKSKGMERWDRAAGQYHRKVESSAVAVPLSLLLET